MTKARPNIRKYVALAGFTITGFWVLLIAFSIKSGQVSKKPVEFGFSCIFTVVLGKASLYHWNKSTHGRIM